VERPATRRATRPPLPSRLFDRLGLLPLAGERLRPVVAGRGLFFVNGCVEEWVGEGGVALDETIPSRV
jgi:hypothetical protein